MIMHKSTIFGLIFLLSSILLVSSQSTAIDSQIDNRSCNVDSDCVNNPENGTFSTRLGNFMCVNNHCKFVVAAGQHCREATDCVAYHYSSLRNISLRSEICSSKHCNLNSKCDGAWDQTDISSIPNIGDQSTCCIGLFDGSECEIVANDVNPCTSNCHFNEKTNSKICVDEDTVNVNQRKTIWIGVLICLIGSTTLNIGLNVQKYAFTLHQEELDRESHSASHTNDDHSTKSSIKSLERSTLYRKLEKFMFWKQIIVSPTWVLGFGIYVIGSLLNFVSLKFAPQSLVAPLGAVSLVVNLLIAPILHKQKLTLLDIIGVIIIIIGSVVITLFSGVVIQDYKLCVLIVLFKRPQTIIYLTVIGVFIFSLFTFIRVVEKNAAQKDKDAIAKAIAVAVELAVVDGQEKAENTNYPTIYTVDFDKSTNNEDKVNDNRSSYRLSIKLDGNRKSLMEEINHSVTFNKDKDDNISLEDEIKSVPLPRNSISSIRTTRSVVRQRTIKEKVLLPLAYAILASNMATITTLFAKSLINLLTVSIVQKDNQFEDLLSWTILFITFATAIGQIYWISMGLKKYDALLQVPIFYCNWSLFDIIGGGIYYDEFHDFKPITYVGFIVGIFLIFFGVSLLSKRLSKLTKEEEELKEIQKKWEQEMKKKKMSKIGDRKKR